MLRLREASSDCFGLAPDQDIRLHLHLFGHLLERVPEAPADFGVRRISLLDHLRRVDQRRIELNVWRIGSDLFSNQDNERIDFAIFRMRQIYEQSDLTVGRIRHYARTESQSKNLDTPTSESDLQDITETWSGHQNGIDVFFPANMNVSITLPDGSSGVLLGISPIEGPCDTTDSGLQGAVCGIWSFDRTARTFSHELGHYLGLEHPALTTDPAGNKISTRPDSLMAQTWSANSARNSTDLNNTEGSDLRDHCAVEEGC